MPQVAWCWLDKVREAQYPGPFPPRVNACSWLLESLLVPPSPCLPCARG